MACETINITSRIKISISKEELALLPPVHYEDGATIVDSADALPEAIDTLRSASIIGFDTETRPSFRKGVSHKVSLLQLATPERCFLFRLKALGLPPELAAILEDESLLKVGVSLHDDFHQLSKLGIGEPKGFVDLQQYVKGFGIADNSLSRIHGIIFGERIAKGQRLTNWEAPELTEAQINYAALDAIACIRIYRHLQAGLFKPEESAYIKTAD